jgi:hypothetical protein
MIGYNNKKKVKSNKILFDDLDRIWGCFSIRFFLFCTLNC